jgi:hypothetical protein
MREDYADVGVFALSACADEVRRGFEGLIGHLQAVKISVEVRMPAGTPLILGHRGRGEGTGLRRPSARRGGRRLLCVYSILSRLDRIGRPRCKLY